MKIRKLNAATALGSLTASVALLAGMQGAHAQGAPGAGSFPGSFLVPGTQTSFKVGGYVKLGYTYDFGQMQAPLGGVSPFGLALDSGMSNFLDFNSGNATFFVNHLNIQEDKAHQIHGASRMTASESRFNIETRTPTAYGELKTFIEGDFTDPNGLSHSSSFMVNSNSSGFRLRQAYGTLGPFLAGQTLSLFRDGNSEAETLDFGGAQANGVTRQPQVRYTFDFGNGLTWAVAAENPQSQVMDLNCTSFIATGLGDLCVTQASRQTTFGQGQADKIPDFTTAVVYNAPWGHLNLHGVVRDIYWHTVNAGNEETGAKDSHVGWAVGFSGNWNVPIGKDSLAWEAAYGQGAGRYVNSDGPPTPDAFLLQDEVGGVPRKLQTIPSYLFMVNYTHYWTDMLRSNIAYSYWHQDNEDAVVNTQGFSPGATSSGLAAANNLYTRTQNAYLNLIWSPVPQVNLGIEYNWQYARLQNGRTGFGNRLQMSAQFKF